MLARQDLGFSASSMKIHIAAIEFLYSVALDRPEAVVRVRFPEVHVKPLDIPKLGEVDACPPEVSYLGVPVCAFCAFSWLKRDPAAKRRRMRKRKAFGPVITASPPPASSQGAEAPPRRFGVDVNFNIGS